MPQDYTYYGGQKVELKKRADQFTVRALPPALEAHGFVAADQVSSGSSCVRCPAEDLERMMTRGRSVAPTHHVYERADSGQEFLLTDRVMIRFKNDAPQEEIDALVGKYGLVRIASFGDRDSLYQLTSHTGINPVKLVVRLVEDEARLVDVAENDLNHRVHTTQFTVPTDDFYIHQWHLHNRLNSPDVDHRSSSRVEQAWIALNSTGDSDMVIAITDDGCRMDHPDFDSPNKFAGWGYFRANQLLKEGDFAADRNKMYQTGQDHGTSCAGVAAAELDGIHTVGAAPTCRLLPIKWESSGRLLFISDSKLRLALDYVADKVDIISNSWGGRPTTSWGLLTQQKIQQLADTGGRRGRGIVFLWAAGNENCPIHHSGPIKVPFTNGWNCEGNPIVCEWVGHTPGESLTSTFTHVFADVAHVMLIGAVASTARRSHYSNYGTGLSLSAPSSNSHAFFRLTVAGRGITTATGSGGDLSQFVTSQFGGTSSATPLVAGIAALVLSANPRLSAGEVIAILKRTASKDLDMTAYPRTPPAAFDLDTSWDVSPIAPFDDGAFQGIGSEDGTWSPWFGHGLVNAEAAVQAAANPETLSLNAAPAAGTSVENRDLSRSRSNMQGGRKTKASSRKRRATPNV